MSDALKDLLQKFAVPNLPQNDFGVKGVEYIRRKGKFLVLNSVWLRIILETNRQNTITLLYWKI